MQKTTIKGLHENTGLFRNNRHLEAYKNDL